jgi:glyoxylase-like metal-dependent hydrolase (beta-lactamase superfamily II)
MSVGAEAIARLVEENLCTTIATADGSPGLKEAEMSEPNRTIGVMHELRAGLWHWQAPHPQWEPTEPWDQRVSSYAVDDGERLMLLDPIAPPSEILDRAVTRETAVVLTAPWHERDTHSLVERLNPPVFTPTPETAQELMDKFGLTAEQVGDGSPDVAWLLKEGKGEAHVYAAGDRLPGDIEAFPGHKRNDLVLWIESKRAVVSGDTLVDFGKGLELNDRWLQSEGMTREQLVEGLRPLLELPVEHMLATHGGPFDRAALERALS